LERRAQRDDGREHDRVGERSGNLVFGFSRRVGGSGPAGAESAQFNVTPKPLICVLGICIG
jgi:hypothetical protein